MIDDHDRWMFLLVPAHLGCPRQNPESHKMVLCVCVCLCYLAVAWPGFKPTTIESQVHYTTMPHNTRCCTERHLVGLWWLWVVICADVCTAYWPVGREDDIDVHFDDAGAASGPGSKKTSRVRVEFPETWLWSELSTGYHLMPAIVLVLC